MQKKQAPKWDCQQCECVRIGVAELLARPRLTTLPLNVLIAHLNEIQEQCRRCNKPVPQSNRKASCS